ncbi:hypothetical protein SAMN05216302_101913 [Nitrosomonas aestuarii]|uniref:Uncharacterized protein n=1 Tax=Nitrosomonas aestuarii TaxID=52441 RepID=A0A1I4D475_9PROT|nr:hypothetical protein SAMN05216302_101913 [Nitrosomonas aestuarii]
MNWIILMKLKSNVSSRKCFDSYDGFLLIAVEGYFLTKADLIELFV